MGTLARNFFANKLPIPQGSKKKNQNFFVLTLNMMEFVLLFEGVEDVLMLDLDNSVHCLERFEGCTYENLLTYGYKKIPGKKSTEKKIK